MTAASLSPASAQEDCSGARATAKCEGDDDKPEFPQIPDATVLIGEPGGLNHGDRPEPTTIDEEPYLSLVSMNPRSAGSLDLVRGNLRGKLTVVPELPPHATAIRPVRRSCGRDPSNSLVVADSRVSALHFTLRVQAARGGFVTLDLVDESGNGTWVNGNRVGKGCSVPLAVGDQILLLSADHVGRTAEVGFILLYDARGAHCGRQPVGTGDVSSDCGAPAESSCSQAAVSCPVSPKAVAVDVPRALELDLQCGICTDSLYRCLTLVPCGHNFCTACLVRWRRRSHNCPECRAAVHQAVRNAAVDRIVETFNKAHPEGARTEDEVRLMDVAEMDASNVGMLRWLLRPGPSWEGMQHDPRQVATPARSRQEADRHWHRTRQQQENRSRACVIC